MHTPTYILPYMLLLPFLISNKTSNRYICTAQVAAHSPGGVQGGMHGGGYSLEGSGLGE